MCKNSATNFYEKLGLINYFVCAFSGKDVYYLSHSFIFELIKKLVPALTFPRARLISYGCLNKVTAVRSNAYGSALKALEKINSKSWRVELIKNTSFDNQLIVDKFIFQKLFEKYEFYGLAIQYSKENTGRRVKLVAESLFSFDQLSNCVGIDVVVAMSWRWFDWLVSLLLIPVYAFVFCLKNRRSTEPEFSHSVFCEVDSETTVTMFADLFQEQRISYLIERGYLKNFSSERITSLKLIPYGLGFDKRLLIVSMMWRVWCLSFYGAKRFANMGGVLYEIFQVYLRGVLRSPIAIGCTFMTFEHLTVEKAVRNEFLKSSGNLSIFVPYNIYLSSPMYAPEFRLNYDILCSPGLLCERAYHMQKATTKIIVATGAYHANKRLLADAGADARIKVLADFKGCDVLITVLCNGVEDATYSGELRLLNLVEKLAEVPGVKVALRLKPVNPPEKYRDFYKNKVELTKDVLITHTEHELYDFFGVTDLFVTSNSNSVLEFCSAGAPVFSIDFWSRDDLFLWQTAVPGVYLDELHAFGEIMAWVTDFPRGSREIHKKRMVELSSMISYKYVDFDAYLENFRLGLKPYIPHNASLN
jgi:hypothetical protein